MKKMVVFFSCHISHKEGKERNQLEKPRTKEIPALKKMTKEGYEELVRYQEKKCAIIENLHKVHMYPVITVRANYPGKEKNNDITRLVNEEISKTMQEIFKEKILVHEAYETPEGPTMFYVMKGDARTLKENAIFIEQSHELGRFVDIDVYDTDEEYAVGRIELAYEPRKCFLCDRAAKVCAKEKSHPVEELVAYMEEMVSHYLKDHSVMMK